MDLSNAISKHSEWKTRFRTAIAKQEVMDAASISTDNACELGQWLHGPGRARTGQLASYSACVAKHAAFHKEAGKVAQAINAKKFHEAEAMLGNAASYGVASAAVGVAIIHLKKEAGL